MSFSQWYSFYQKKGFNNGDAASKARTACVRLRGTRYRSTRQRAPQLPDYSADRGYVRKYSGGRMKYFRNRP